MLSQDAPSSELGREVGKQGVGKVLTLEELLRNIQLWQIAVPNSQDGRHT